MSLPLSSTTATSLMYTLVTRIRTFSISSRICHRRFATIWTSWSGLEVSCHRLLIFPPEARFVRFSAYLYGFSAYLFVRFSSYSWLLFLVSIQPINSNYNCLFKMLYPHIVLFSFIWTFIAYFCKFFYRLQALVVELLRGKKLHAGTNIRDLCCNPLYIT